MLPATTCRDHRCRRLLLCFQRLSGRFCCIARSRQGASLGTPPNFVTPFLQGSNSSPLPPFLLGQEFDGHNAFAIMMRGQPQSRCWEIFFFHEFHLRHFYLLHFQFPIIFMSVHAYNRLCVLAIWSLSRFAIRANGIMRR